MELLRGPSSFIKVASPTAELTPSGWYITSGPELPLDELNGDIECECVVIGAGWMGLHAAQRYAELRPLSKVVLVDAGRIGDNASGRCMGFAIDLAHNPRKQNFIEDIKGNREELEVNLDGNAYLRSAVENRGVDCDWDPQGKYHCASTAHGVGDLVSFSRALDAMGQSYRWVEKEEIRHLTGSSHYVRAIHHPGTILLQPAKYLKNAVRAMPENVTVFENTPVKGVRYGKPLHILETPGGTISTKKVIIATAGHLQGFGFHPRTAIPLYTFASMTRQLTASELSRVGGNGPYGLIPANSFGTTVRRTNDDRLLLRNVYSYAANFRATAKELVFARKQHQVAFDRRWPELSGIGFVSSWGGLLTLSRNGGMVFGELADSVYGVAFCNGTGVSRGTAFGKAVAELAAGKSSPIIEILKKRAGPSKSYPQPIMSAGVRMVTGWRFRQAGREV